MFSKVSDKGRIKLLQPGTNKNQTLSIISANLRITGNLVTDGVIQLDGIVDGDVTCEDLTVGEAAVINGSVESNQVRVAGTVNGEISARNVELTRNAKVIGDIDHTSLMIEAGAHVQGLCRHVEVTEIEPVATLAEPKKPNLVVAEKSLGGAKPAAQPKAAVGGKKR